MTDKAFLIRPYQAGDTDAVIAAWQKANALAHPFLSQAFVEKVRQDLRGIYLPNAETWVLEEASAVTGFIALFGNEIGGLFLEPSRHGRGYGKALVDHAVALKGPLKVEVFRDNAIGRRFYERCGFEFAGDEVHEPSGQVSWKMAMPGA